MSKEPKNTTKGTGMDSVVNNKHMAPIPIKKDTTQKSNNNDSTNKK